LTGAPTETIEHGSIDVSTFWEKLFKADKKNYVMACAIGSDDNQGEHKSKGLASDHAYTLIGAYDVDGHKLVKVRNPWGQFEWNGAWGDKDPNWTESMKRQVNFKNANDGVFYMAIEDYKATFGSTTICKVHDDYNLETIN